MIGDVHVAAKPQPDPAGQPGYRQLAAVLFRICGGAASEGDRTRLLILLAEHDPYAAELQEYFLKTEGFEVEVALGEEAARESFDETSPSLVVIEILISGGAGFSLCRSFKETHDVPIVAVSVMECRDQALEAGADAFLLKPLEPLQFVSTVRDLLGSSAFLQSGSRVMAHE